MQSEAQNGPLDPAFGVSVYVQPELLNILDAEPYENASLQAQRSWLKLLASANILHIFVTELVSQSPIASLKLDLP